MIHKGDSSQLHKGQSIARVVRHDSINTGTTVEAKFNISNTNCFFYHFSVILCVSDSDAVIVVGWTGVLPGPAAS